MIELRDNRKIVIDNPEYKTLKERILRYERDLLRTVGFDFQVELPYTHLIRQSRLLGNSKLLAPSSRRNQSLAHQMLVQKELVMAAWNFVNDR